MKKLALLVLFFGAVVLKAQVTFIIDSLPDYTPPEDDIYLAGDINGWNPGDINHKFQKNLNNRWEHSLDSFPEGITIAFKFTRGDWSKVEKGPVGEEIADRTFTFGNADTVRIVIYNWADASGGNSTAAENVIIMDEDFEMPQLNRTRRIWLYLPPSYYETEKSYPVLYMHDGQNLFDEFTSFAGEWEVDETLNQLAAEGFRVPIVVGIDNGDVYRIDELTPWNNPDYGGGQGDDYMAFIVETLKPYVDYNYRTLPDRLNTGIMGSSLGGLISTYGAIKYQHVFSKSGPFSPAYWINNDSIWNFIYSNEMLDDIQVYQNIGEYEGNTNIDMMYKMEDSLLAAGYTDVTSKVIAGGNHNEATWRDDFRNAYLWLFDAYANDVKEEVYRSLLVSPNPVHDRVYLVQDDLNIKNNIQYYIISVTGQNMLSGDLSNPSIEVNGLIPGVYIISVKTQDKLYIGKFIKL